MSTQIPIQKNAAYIFYMGLPSIAAPNNFLSAPTIVAGDFQVSIDGGALANLITTPSALPAGGASIQVSLAAAEMNGDNIVIVAQQQTGNTWKSVLINIQTSNNAVAGAANANITYINGTAVSVPATAGILDVNVKNINNIAATPITTIKAVQGLTTADTVVNLTNAPTAGDLTATMKASVTTAATAATPTAAAVTATVAANVTKVNGVAVDGTGTPTDPWGPA